MPGTRDQTRQSSVGPVSSATGTRLSAHGTIATGRLLLPALDPRAGTRGRVEAGRGRPGRGGRAGLAPVQERRSTVASPCTVAPWRNVNRPVAQDFPTWTSDTITSIGRFARGVQPNEQDM